eukprot:3917260-Rhodomonas_salina.2
MAYHADMIRVRRKHLDRLSGPSGLRAHPPVSRQEAEVVFFIRRLQTRLLGGHVSKSASMPPRTGQSRRGVAQCSRSRSVGGETPLRKTVAGTASPLSTGACRPVPTEARGVPLLTVMATGRAVVNSSSSITPGSSTGRGSSARGVNTSASGDSLRPSAGLIPPPSGTPASRGSGAALSPPPAGAPNVPGAGKRVEISRGGDPTLATSRGGQGALYPRDRQAEACGSGGDTVARRACSWSPSSPRQLSGRHRQRGRRKLLHPGGEHPRSWRQRQTPRRLGPLNIRNAGLQQFWHRTVTTAVPRRLAQLARVGQAGRRQSDGLSWGPEGPAPPGPEGGAPPPPAMNSDLRPPRSLDHPGAPPAPPEQEPRSALHVGGMRRCAQQGEGSHRLGALTARGSRPPPGEAPEAGRPPGSTHQGPLFRQGSRPPTHGTGAPRQR